MATKKRPQLKLPGTLPPLRNARAEMWAAMAAMEEWEDEVENKAASLAGAKQELDGAKEEHRRKLMILREVENEPANRQVETERDHGKR